MRCWDAGKRDKDDSNEEKVHPHKNQEDNIKRECYQNNQDGLVKVARVQI